MTTTALPERTLFQSFLREPLDLAMSQPHQALISLASAYLVQAEAGVLIAMPFNIFLAVGAEWAYLRGMSSAQGVQSRWARWLNVAAVVLVVAYGSLWGLRKFGVIPDAPSPFWAVVLTLVHILCISAVTLCSAMVHRDMLEQEQIARFEAAQIERDREAARYQQEQEREQRRLAFEEHERNEKARIEREHKEEAARLELETQARYRQMKIEEERRAIRATNRVNRRQLVDTDTSTNGVNQRRSPLTGVDIHAAIAAHGSAAAVARHYGVSRQAVDKKLKAATATQNAQVDTSVDTNKEQ